MVEYKYWLENIVAAAKLIASGDALSRAWSQGDKTITSAYDPDEFLEQVLGDLHIEEDVHIFETNLRRIGAYDAIAALAEALIKVEGATSRDPRLRDPATLLASPAWGGVRAAANQIIQLPDAEAD